MNAWTDKHVIAPNAMIGMAGKDYKSWQEIKLAHRAHAGGNHAPDFERSADGRIVGRAPVSFAWARRNKPVLIALLSGLTALYPDESDAAIWATAGGTGDRDGTMGSAEIVNSWSPTDECHIIADAIFALTSDITTWQQWNEFCDTLNLNGTTNDEPRAKADLLKANFNPNSDLNKFNPNNTLWKLVDKSDLLAYSTEFSFLPQGYEVESVGRVLGPGGRLLASRVAKAVIGGPSQIRLDTQKEFVCDNLGDLDTPGDETVFRKPGYQIGACFTDLRPEGASDPLPSRG